MTFAKLQPFSGLESTGRRKSPFSSTSLPGRIVVLVVVLRVFGGVSVDVVVVTDRIVVVGAPGGTHVSLIWSFSLFGLPSFVAMSTTLRRPTFVPRLVSGTRMVA